MKKFRFLLIFFFLTSCGYTPLFEKSTEYNFGVGEIELIGEKKINRELKQLLESFKNNNSTNIINLKITSTKSTRVITKDKKGNPSSFKTNINISCVIIDNSTMKETNKVFQREASYNFLKNQFETDLYKSNLERNILTQLKNDLIVYLNLLNNDL